MDRLTIRRRREPPPDPMLYPPGSPDWWTEMERLHQASRVGEPMWMRWFDRLMGYAAVVLGWLAYVVLFDPKGTTFGFFILWTLAIWWIARGRGRIDLLKAQHQQAMDRADATWQQMQARRQLEQQPEQPEHE